MRIDELNKAWEHEPNCPITRELTFDGDFLVLGAQTRLAKVGATVDEPRLDALLGAAHGRPATTSSLRHVRRAIETWRDGKKLLALTHLALSGLAKLAHPNEDARRLFVADALVGWGVDPMVIVEALTPSTLGKYNPDQPRVPAGHTDGGQWARDEGTGNNAPHRSSDSSGDPIQVAWDDLDQTCDAFIAANCQARIRRESPG